MPIKKQDFYEGAAVYQLVRSGRLKAIRHEHPYLIINDSQYVYLKYSTKGRSPWPFTFAPDEQSMLHRAPMRGEVTVGLVCGADGIVALPADEYRVLAISQPIAIHISCRRSHGEHYQVSGPNGVLSHKIAPTAWRHLLEEL